MARFDVIEAGDANTVDEQEEVFGRALVGAFRVLVADRHGEEFVEPLAVRR